MFYFHQRKIHHGFNIDATGGYLSFSKFKYKYFKRNSDKKNIKDSRLIKEEWYGEQLGSLDYYSF
jgi:hypothetical protein